MFPSKYLLTYYYYYTTTTTIVYFNFRQEEKNGFFTPLRVYAFYKGIILIIGYGDCNLFYCNRLQAFNRR